MVISYYSILFFNFTSEVGVGVGDQCR